MTTETENFTQEYEQIKVDIASKIALLVLNVVKDKVDSIIEDPETLKKIEKELDRTKAVESMVGQMIMDYVNIVLEDIFPAGEEWWKVCPWNKPKPT